MMRMDLLQAGVRLWARTLITNIVTIKDALNKLTNDFVAIGALTPLQFSTEVIQWLNTFLPGRVRPDLNHNMLYMASETAIRYTEGNKTDINPWPHTWVSGTTTVEYDVDAKEIRFFQSAVLFKKVTITGWV